MPNDKALRELTARISQDLVVESPLGSAWKRALWLLPYALFAAAVLLVTLGLRRDASQLTLLVLWGLALVLLAAAFAVLSFILRESIPAFAMRPSVWLVALLLTFFLQQSAALLTYGQSPLAVADERVLSLGAACLARMAVIGLLPLVVALFLISRGLPLRPRLSGLIAGFAGGLTAEAIYRLHCPYSHWEHMLVWHSGAVVLLGFFGFVAGLAFEARRLESWRRRRS